MSFLVLNRWRRRQPRRARDAAETRRDVGVARGGRCCDSTCRAGPTLTECVAQLRALPYRRAAWCIDRDA